MLTKPSKDMVATSFFRTRPNPPGAFSRYLAFGDSLTEGISGSPANKFVNLVATHYGITATNYGVGGDTVPDQLNEVLTPTFVGADLVSVWLGTNDKILSQDKTTKLENYASGHLALLLLAGVPTAARVTAQAMTTDAGVWSNFADGTAKGAAFTSSSGGVKSATVFGRFVAYVGIWNQAQAGRTAIAIDGEIVETFTSQPDGGEAVSEDIQYGPYCRIYDTGSLGYHKISVANADGAQPVYAVCVMGFTGERLSGPTLIVPNLYDLTSAANTTYGITQGRNSKFNSVIERNIAICNMLGINASLADVAAEIDLTTDISGDALHLNTAGHVMVAEQVIAAAKASGREWPIERQYQIGQVQSVALRGRVHNAGRPVIMSPFGPVASGSDGLTPAGANVFTGQNTFQGTTFFSVPVMVATTTVPTGSQAGVWMGSTGIVVGTPNTSATVLIAAVNGNGTVGGVQTSGTATNFLTSSDADLKDDDGELPDDKAMEILRLISIHEFRWKESGEADIGVFAQELYEVYPKAVSVDPWSVDYSKLVPVLVRALQGLDQRIAALEAASE